MFNNANRILVVAAHPDDEVLGCGGAIARARDYGVEVGVMFLGEGVSARFEFGDYENEEFRAQTLVREEGMKRALKFLDVKLLRSEGYYCTQFDSLPLLKLVKSIEDVIHHYKPSTILTHSPSEVNIDHRLVFEAVEVACRPVIREKSISVYSFEVVCSGSFKFINSFNPNYYVDITKFFEKKIEAWQLYTGEARPFPFPRSNQGLKVLANYRGMQVGVEYAEAYHLNRGIF